MSNGKIETAEDRVAEILSPHLAGMSDADEIVRQVIEASRGPIYDRLMALLDGDSDKRVQKAAELGLMAAQLLANLARREARAEALAAVRTALIPTPPMLANDPAFGWEHARDKAILALADIPPQPEPQPEPEWIPWHGGPRPIAPEALVEVRLRSGEVLSSSLSTASMWAWQHRGWPVDVMAYRIKPSERP